MWLLLLIPAVLLFAAGSAKASTPPTVPSAAAKPIAVGVPSNSKVAPLLAELDAYLASQGVDTKLFPAVEITRMWEAPGQPNAIPPRDYWPAAAYTLREVAQPLRRAMATSFQVRGYRPPDYNAAVGGAPNSLHQWFAGFDLYSLDTSRRRELALRAAQFYRQHGEALRMGFGAYGYPNPSNIHVDAGQRKAAVAYREAPDYLRDVGAVA